MRSGAERERGAILIWSVFAIFMVAVLAAVVVNVGHLTTTRGELQNAVDAAALASARELTGRAPELTSADGIAEAQAAAHRSDRFDVAASDVRFGAWVPPNRPCDTGDAPMPLDRRDGYSTDAYRFCEVTGTDPASAFRVNAVYVRSRRADAAPGGGAVPMLFGGLLGQRTADVTASAIAVTGGPCGGCDVQVPMVVGVGCLTDNPGGGGGAICDPAMGADAPGPLYTLGLSPTPVRSAGWSVFSTVAPSEQQICSFLKAGGGTCPDVGAEIEMVDVGQGNKFNGACKSPKQSTVKNICDWFKGFVDQTVDVPVISYSGGTSEACPSNYVGRAYIVGYATYRVLAVNCTATSTHPDCVEAPGTGYCLDSTAPCSVYASGKCVLTQLVCNHINGANHSTGCVWTGTSPLRPVLVR
jgi:Flp pilus assembly protein TadG